MSTYVISDIHGCYEQFLLLLEKIRFGADDQLILAGDAIDRGTGSFDVAHSYFGARLIFHVVSFS